MLACNVRLGNYVVSLKEVCLLDLVNIKRADKEEFGENPKVEPNHPMTFGALDEGKNFAASCFSNLLALLERERKKRFPRLLR